MKQVLGRVRTAVIVLSFIVAYFGSMLGAALLDLDDQSMPRTPVGCPRVEHPLPCKDGEVLFHILGMRWPPFAIYALIFGIGAALIAFRLTRKLVEGELDVQAQLARME